MGHALWVVFWIQLLVEGFQVMGEPAIQQKKRLAAVAINLEPGGKGGIRHGSKIDVGRNVLQARIYEWLIMGMMTKMTHERALMPLWVIVLMLGKAIVDRKSTRLNSSHVAISYAVFCLKKKK